MITVMNALPPPALADSAFSLHCGVNHPAVRCGSCEAARVAPRGNAFSWLPGLVLREFDGVADLALYTRNFAMCE